MAESNKILTVSYGTFSCTLEGFDDPFGTMRGIAEYFRDLAADDRYFGAEPPTPDVEMLQNIAQGEVRRRVEARMGDNGVALRQVEAEPAPVKKAPKPAPAAEVDIVDDVDEETLEHGPLAMQDDYMMSDEPEDVLTVDLDAVPEDAAPAETVAEKLRRIRAVVSRSRTPEDEEISNAFAEDAGGAAPRRDRALSETIASITADLSDDDDVDVASAEAAPAPAEEAPVSSSQDAAAPYKASEDTASAEAEDDTIQPDELSAFEETGEAVDEQVAEESAPEDEPAFEASDEDEAPSDEETLKSVMAHAATLSDEDYEDEAAEDAGVTDEDSEPSARRPSKPLAPISESDSGRLMAETDEKLNEDEGIRRRRVISQMRAAVAATKAERSIAGEPASPEERAEVEQSDYRKVLSDIVVPRSQDEAELAAMATTSRPAPLVLVSSQRVDEMPRREAPAATPREDASEELSGFASFAAEVGAKELPELLEAAAAYTAFVKGQPYFSRPEIMKRVARFDPEMNLSREAGLRSFGQLLRQGKIRKLQRGQFTIPEDTRFNPAHRIAGE